MKKLLLAGILGGCLLSAANITPYFSLISYSKQTDKKFAYIGGLYFSNTHGQYKIENDFEYLDLKYDTIPDYKEFDWTFVINYFNGYNYKYRFGVHNIFTSTPDTYVYTEGFRTYQKTDYIHDYDFVVFTGIMYYKYLKYNTGIDVYYSNYKTTDVYQISPYYGFDFGDYYSKIGSFYFKTTVNFIDITKKVTPKTNYTNVDLQLQNFKGPWITTFKTSIGKTAYKVANDGFVVYNLGEEYKSVYSLEIGKKIKNNSFISVNLGYSDFVESDGKDGSSNIIGFTFSHNF